MVQNIYGADDLSRFAPALTLSRFNYWLQSRCLMITVKLSRASGKTVCLAAMHVLSVCHALSRFLLFMHSGVVSLQGDLLRCVMITFALILVLRLVPVV